MTVIVGFNAGDFILFGADGRETAPDGTYCDVKQKIQPIALGLITSSGSVGFGDLVTYLMTRTNRPQDLGSAIQRAFTDLTANKPALRQQVYQLTSWLMSYRTADGLILASSHPSKDHIEYRIPKADFAFLPPQGMSDDDSNGLAAFLHQRATEFCELTEPTTAKMERFARLTQFVVEQCAKRTATVGPTFQLGLHMLDGLVQVSDLMSAVDSCQWHPAVRDCN